MSWIEETLHKFIDKKVLIVGDVMIDRYLTGHVSRISPEAPVPIVNLDNIENRLGGAANVALNINALKATPIIASIVGNDENGKLFKKVLSGNNIDESFILESKYRITTVKSRIISSNQQMLRIDSEITTDLNDEDEGNFVQLLAGIIKEQDPHVILLQDYNKGVLTANVIEWITKQANLLSIPVAVDPKNKNFFKYKNVTLFKPNLKEVKEALAMDIHPVKDELIDASAKIREHIHNDITLITLSENGVFIDDNISSNIYPTHPRNVSDVCGAGDTVISIVSLGLASGISTKELAILANYSGGQVCEKPGVVPVDKEQLLTELANFE